MVIFRDKIQYEKAELLLPYDKNNKKHPEEQISLMVQAIKKFGFTNPLLVDENNVIIAGHGRYEAGKKLGIDKFPVIRIKDLSEGEKRAMRISDNRISELAETDWLNLKEEWLDLQENGAGLEFLTGYDESDFDIPIEPEFDVSKVEEDYEKYTNAQVKQITLYFDSNEYVIYLKKLDDLAEGLQLEDNTAVVKYLVDKYENNRS